MNVIQLLEENAQNRGNQTAFIFREQPITFTQLKESVFKFADGLRSLGIGKGDKVALYLPTSPEYVISYLAVWCCGATAVPLDFMLTEDELVSCMSHSETKILIMRLKMNASTGFFKRAIGSLKEIINCGDPGEGALNFSEVLARGRSVVPSEVAQEKDCAIIFYTSGTTGKPKGVLVNYLQLGAPPEAIKFFVNNDIKEGDVTVCALPFSHLGGLIYIQNCLTFGLTVVLMERFVPLEFLRLVSQYKASCFWIVPSMYYAFLQLKEFETFDLSSLRWIVTFGASNSPDALRRFHQFCPKAYLLNGWGLTETNAPTTVLPMGATKIESVGRPAPGIDVKVFDDADKEVPVGVVGEVVVKGWVVTDGYFKDAPLTSETIRNGWFHSGDLGKIDQEGFLYIVGRKKEMIKVGGEIVFEPEVEAAIHKHPDVAEVAVVGVAHNLRGEVPKAYIALKQGSVMEEHDLRQFLRQHLAHFKIPHYFEFKSELPKNRIGKVDKEKLRVTASTR